MSAQVESPRKTSRPRKRKGLAEQQSAAWFRTGAFVVGVLLKYWVRCYHSFGTENVPASGGLFVIANHTSGLDPFLLGYPMRRRMPSGPGKTDIFANRFFGYIMRKLGIFPLRQGVADAGAVRAMVELFRAGRVIIVYPEGGRSKDGEMQPFTPDFARLVIKLRAPIVPAGLAGARDVLPIGTFLPKRNVPVAVVYGTPFELSEYYDRKLDSDQVTEAASVLERRVAEVVAVARTERDRVAGRS